MKTTVRKMIDVLSVLNGPAVQGNGDKVFAIYCGAIRDEVTPHVRRHHEQLKGSEAMQGYRKALEAWRQENNGRSQASDVERSAVSRELADLVKTHGVAEEIAELDIEAERLADLEFELNIPKMTAGVIPTGIPNGVIQVLMTFGALPVEEAVAWAEKQSEKKEDGETAKTKKGKK